MSEDFSVTSARRAAERGDLETWVHSYLVGPGSNRAFSEGLKQRPRHWREPELLPLSSLRRTCGPEAEMPFRESADAWQRRVADIAASFHALEDFPPLIARYTSGELLVNDGSHRLAAFEALGSSHCWVIVWYADEAELAHYHAHAGAT